MLNAKAKCVKTADAECVANYTDNAAGAAASAKGSVKATGCVNCASSGTPNTTTGVCASSSTLFFTYAMFFVVLLLALF